MNYEILEHIGTGKFGDVWSGFHVRTGEKVAIKRELQNNDYKMLKHEATVLHYLYSQGCRRIPLIYWFGLQEDCPVLIMTHYDITLDEYAKDKNMTKELCNSYTKQMIYLVQCIHNHSILHRDIKPENFMFKGDVLHLIDFGLASVLDDKDHRKDNISDSPDSESVAKEFFNGTPKYASFYIHSGLKASRRDDLISTGYIYMYLSCGRRLPWENIPYHREKEESCLYPQNHLLHYKNEERKHRKSWDKIQQYCNIIGSEILEYMSIVYSLKDTDIPNYSKLMSICR